VQLVFGLNDAWGIGKNDLVLISCQEAFDPVPGGLHFGGNNCQLLTDECVKQSTLSRIGLTEYVNKTCLHIKLDSWQI
jgi:hypothetical protein